MKYCLLLLFLVPYLLGAQSKHDFVKINKHQFALDNKPYYYIGTNYWYGSLLAYQIDEKRGKQRLVHELDFLRSKGINNLRILAGAEGKGIINAVDRVSPPLQPDQGKFDEAVLKGLDYLLSEMDKRNMKAVLYLSNNWEWSGGFLQYLNWNGLIADSTLQRKPGWDELRDQVSKFYSCIACKAAYEKQVKYILNHTNVYSGIKYINDPAIMAWEVANEPRPMRPAAINDYKEWLLTVASLIKSMDKNHLVTLGTEGTIGTENSEELYTAINTPAVVDYLTIHIWPRNWGWYSDTSISKGLPVVIEKTKDYIMLHEQIAEKIGKPLVIEEFGLPRDEQSFSPKSTTTSRDIYYKSILEQQHSSLLKAGVIAGVNLWAFGGTARPISAQLFWKEGDDYMGDPPQEEQGLNAVFDCDETTWRLIGLYTAKLRSIMDEPTVPR